MEQLSYSFTLDGLDVRFNGEIGSCLGPKREFCTLLIEEMIKPEKKIFMKADGEQYFPVPSQYFFERMLENPSIDERKPKMNDEIIGDLFADGDLGTSISDQDLTCLDLHSVLHQKDFNEESIGVESAGDTSFVQGTSSLKRVLRKKMKEREHELNERLEMMRFAGQFAAQVIMNEDIYVGLQLSKPFVKQILGIPLNHPDDLDLYDHQVFSSIKENEIEELELPFSTDVRNPWNGVLEEISLSAEGEKLITEENKLEYLNDLSEFKLSSSIVKELAMFKKGFFNVIRREKISIFNADEFSLLLNGVSKIDIHDWKKNTVYRGWSSDSLTINWFWSVVSSLREEEKSLLLKFATGTPCVPAGGFSQLMGLGGPTLFTIARGLDVDKLPQASTCFNQLALPAYSSQKALREKLLIAIRHGCEGFAFA